MGVQEQDLRNRVPQCDGLDLDAVPVCQPVEVTNDPSAQYFPWGDVDENGGLYVGYYTRQYGDCESTGCGDYRLSTSADNGV